MIISALSSKRYDEHVHYCITLTNLAKKIYVFIFFSTVANFPRTSIALVPGLGRKPLFIVEIVVDTPRWSRACVQSRDPHSSAPTVPPIAECYESPRDSAAPCPSIVLLSANETQRIGIGIVGAGNANAQCQSFSQSPFQREDHPRVTQP